MIINTGQWKISRALHKLRLFFAEVLSQGRPMKLRLWAFIGLIATQFIVFILMVLLSAGVFDLSKHNLALALQMRFAYQQQSLVNNFTKLGVKGSQLAQELEVQLQAWLKRETLRLGELNGQAQLIEDLLEKLSPPLLERLPAGVASGAFIMLDISNGAAAADDRAGVLMRNLEPNSISLTTPNIWMKFGPFGISRRLGIRILPQWRMEFSGKMLGLYRHYKEKLAKNGSTSSSYYLSSAQSLGSSEDKAFYLCFPLKDPDGALCGVCGFEINAMIFKLLYSNQMTDYPVSIALLAPGQASLLQVSEGLVSAQTPYFSTKAKEDRLVREESESGKLSVYRSSDGESFIGLINPLVVYPGDSVFQDEKWFFGVLVPQKEFRLEEAAARMKVLYWMLMGFALSFVLLILLSIFYMRPIQRTLQQILDGSDSASIKRTGILEIDDLLLFLKEKEQRDSFKELDEETQSVPRVSLKNGRKNGKDSPAPSAYASDACDISQTELDAFRERISSLSPAEKSVFDLYMEGHSAKEITELLHLSINTIKTHNKRIYMKLAVSSRRELLKYVYFLEDENAAAGRLEGKGSESEGSEPNGTDT